MKITFIGHASILIETRGVRILSDPWWRGPCFGAQWWIYPPAHVEPLAEGVDFIYISHGHHDHLHPGTLRTLDRKATCLVSSRIGIAGIPRGLGFPVVELDDDTVHELAPGVRCRIIETHAEDTLFIVEDGERVCVNLNDALHAAPADVQDRFVGFLNKLYPRIDYVFCGYGVASHFPNCYEIPGKDREATAARRQAHFNRQWGRIVAGLSPRFAFPFAADVAFLEDDLLWTNEPTRNAERPTDVFHKLHPGSSTTVVDIAPGFCIENDTVVHNALRQPLSLDRLRSECAESIERAVNVGTGTRAVFDEVLRLVSGNAERCLSYLREFAGDYRFMIRFRNFDRGIMVTKRGDSIVVAEGPADPETVADVTYVTRLNYLRWSLTSEHGHEILFVGSGGIFRYADANDARRNLHRELSVLLVPHAVAPASRFGNTSPVIHRWKRRIRRWLGRRPRDLYDLATWTVWSGTER